jgi:hypothetical protein
MLRIPVKSYGKIYHAISKTWNARFAAIFCMGETNYYPKQHEITVKNRRSSVAMVRMRRVPGIVLRERHSREPSSRDERGQAGPASHCNSTIIHYIGLNERPYRSHLMTRIRC